MAGLVQRRQHGKHGLFEHLTGPEQLWWRCCGGAVRSSDAWLNGNQADQALALIRGEDLGACLPRWAGGAVPRSQHAAGWRRESC
jgi:hypothetical protein